MSLVKALRLVAGYVSLPEAARADLDAILAELEAPEPGTISEEAVSSGGDTGADAVSSKVAGPPVNAQVLE